METKVLYSKPLVDNLALQVVEVVRKLRNKPKLAVLVVGNDPASAIYVKKKQKLAIKLGCECDIFRFDSDVNQSELIEFIEKLNLNSNINGIILQLPLPAHLDAPKLLNIVDISKDVDGLTAGNYELLLKNNGEGLRPATPTGIMRLLAWVKVPLAGVKVAVVGRSRLVGAPTAVMLKGAGAVVELFSLERPISAEITRECDVIISAAGCAGLIRGNILKVGAVVIDVGINRNSTGKMVGDVKADEVLGVASVLTPVPGGVGGMTVISLITNLVEATYLQEGLERPVWRRL